MQKKISGRSMIEILGVLALIGILTIAGLFGYRLAMDSHRANEILKDVGLLHFAIEDNENAFGTSDVAETDFKSSIPYDINGYWEDEANYYIRVDDVSKGVCNALLRKYTAEVSDFLAVSYNDEDGEDGRITEITEKIGVRFIKFAGNNSEICEEKNNMRFYFGLGGVCGEICSSDAGCCGKSENGIDLVFDKKTCSCQCPGNLIESGKDCVCPTINGIQLIISGNNDCICPKDTNGNSLVMINGECKCQQNLLLNILPTVDGVEYRCKTECEEGYILIDGNCEKFSCEEGGGATDANGDQHYNCYIYRGTERYMCGYHCKADGSGCAIGLCTNESCDGDLSYVERDEAGGYRYGCNLLNVDLDVQLADPDNEDVRCDRRNDDKENGSYLCYVCKIDKIKVKDNNGKDVTIEKERDCRMCMSVDKYGNQVEGNCGVGYCPLGWQSSEHGDGVTRFGSCVKGNLNCYQTGKNSDGEQTWVCYKNGYTCASKCTDPNTCCEGKEDYCPPGSTYITITADGKENNYCQKLKCPANMTLTTYTDVNGTKTQRCKSSAPCPKGTGQIETTENGITVYYCDAEGTYYCGTENGRWNQLCYLNGKACDRTSTSTGEVSSAACEDPGCPEGTTYTYMESKDTYGCCAGNCDTVPTKECHFANGGDEIVCTVNGRKCARRCKDYAGKVCEMVESLDCAIDCECPNGKTDCCIGGKNCPQNGYDLSQGGCTCYTGIVSNGHCCPEGHYYIKATGLCAKNQCKEGSYLSGTTCFSECPGILVKNDADRTCSCPYYDNEGICVKSCPEGKYGYNGNCVAACPEETYIYTGDCFDTCPEGTIPDDTNKVCSAQP